jgi:sarcosine oxidase, subunit alpha
MRINPSNALLPAINREKPLKVMLNGQSVDAYEGETIAAVLLAAGIRTFRHTQKNKQSRSIFCGMGICYECLVTVDGVHAVRACVTQVTDGMKIDTCKEVEL